jgi:hypothetical protein
MFKHVRVTGVLAGAAAVMLAASPSLADIGKCSKLIDGEVLKMQSTFAKAFGKCNDSYRKDAAKGVTPPFSKAAPGCEKQLGKAFATLDKETAKLAGKVDGKTCIDADLLALGHLPTSVFGTRWAQTQGVGALQSAYEQQLQGTKDWINMLIDMGAAGSCPTCVKLEAPPCSETACKLASTNDSSSPSKASVDLAGSPTIVVPLSGSTVLKVCDVSSLISSAAGVLYVVGGPGKILDPAPVGAISTACTATIASEGLIQCGAGPQKVSYTQCVDHNAGAPNEAGATTAGDCTGNSCSASMTDIEDPNVINGGTCITLNSGAGTAGDAYINLVSRIALHAPGSDCLDDPTSPGTPQNTALTTGSAQATVKDADDNAGTEASSALISGSPFDCATLKRGDGGTVKLVGAFPAVNTLEPAPGVLLDSTTSFVLECE